jgi:integrase
LLATTYAAGLRVSEVVALKVADLDADRLTIHVCQGKGGQDRYVPLSPRLLQDWRAYWRIRPPHIWLFANRQGTRPTDITVAQKLYTMAKLRAGITKQGGIHALRHNAGSRIMPSWSSASKFSRPERLERQLIYPA